MINTHFSLLLLLITISCLSCEKQPKFFSKPNLQTQINLKLLVGRWYVMGYKLVSITQEGMATDSTGQNSFDYDKEYMPSKLCFEGSSYYGTYYYELPDSNAVTAPIDFLFPARGGWKASASPNTMTLDMLYVALMDFEIKNFYGGTLNLVGTYYDKQAETYRKLTLYLEN